MLPPHPFDDDLHRAQIHRAFDTWARAYEQGAHAQARRLRAALARLCTEAIHRERTVLVNRALASFRSTDEALYG